MGGVKKEDLIALMKAAVEQNVRSLPVVVEVPKIGGVAKGDEETLVLVLSDVHFGHKTPTTSSRVVANRLARLSRRIVRIAKLLRPSYTIKNLVVFWLGDNVQHDLVGRFVSLDELEGTVMKQVFKWAVPNFERFFLTLAQHFERVDVYCVRGNHGMTRKNAGEDTNWDTVIYKTVELRLQNQKNIRFKIEEDGFYQIVKIYKWGFFITHGDSIRTFLNIPFYGQIQRAMRMRGAVRGNFHYVVYGHFHVAAVYAWNDMEIFTNGCFVTDDQWVLKKMGMASSAVQLLFGVHPRKGVTFRYRVWLD